MKAKSMFCAAAVVGLGMMAGDASAQGINVVRYLSQETDPAVVVNAAMDAWNAGDVDALKGLFADDAVVYFPDWDETISGREEIDAWKGYLKHYPDGRWALRATDHLNALGDFSYRNFTIGYRRVTLARIPFRPGSAELPSRGKPSIQVLGSILSINEKIGLEISGYEKNDPALATARAKAVRDYLLQHFPTINPSRLKYGGKGDAEKVEIGDRTYRLNESISFVTTSK